MLYDSTTIDNVIFDLETRFKITFIEGVFKRLLGNIKAT